MDMFVGDLSFITPQTSLQGPLSTILAMDFPYYSQVFSGSKISGLPTRKMSHVESKLDCSICIR